MEKTDTSIGKSDRKASRWTDLYILRIQGWDRQHIYSGLDGYIQLSLLEKHAMRCPRFESSKVRFMVCLSSERRSKTACLFSWRWASSDNTWRHITVMAPSAFTWERSLGSGSSSHISVVRDDSDVVNAVSSGLGSGFQIVSPQIDDIVFR
jgi:hypothetical protein